MYLKSCKFRVVKHFLLISLLFLVVGGCKKECGLNHDSTARKLDGKWKVDEVVSGGDIVQDTGERFIFRKCKNNCAAYTHSGVFITVDGKEEEFIWGLKGNSFSIQPSDTADVVNKYSSHMGRGLQEKCTRTKMVFGDCDSYCLVLKKSK